MKRYDHAEIAYQRSIEHDPYMSQSWNNLILLKQKRNYLEEAYQVALKALSYNPNDDTLHFLLANLLGMQNQLEDAEFHFKKAIQLNSNKAIYYNNLAVLYHKNKMYPLARMWYEKTLSIEPNRQSTLKNLENIQHL